MNAVKTKLIKEPFATEPFLTEMCHVFCAGFAGYIALFAFAWVFFWLAGTDPYRFIVDPPRNESRWAEFEWNDDGSVR